MMLALRSILTVLCLLGTSVLALAESSSLRRLQTDGSPSLVEYLVGNGNYSTLVSLVSSYPDLVDALSADGADLTVFGPSDAAFAKLDPALVAKLVTPEYQSHLKDILMYHVAPGSLASGDVVSIDNITMLNGEVLIINVSEAGVGLQNMYQNATLGFVELLDINASNGIFHGIDGVLLPSFLYNDLVDVAVSAPDTFNTLTQLVTAAGLVDVLKDGEFTILAPTDAAFAAVPNDTIAMLTDPANIELLKSVLLYHVLPGVLPAGLLSNGTMYTTAEGSNVTLTITDTGVMFNGANVELADILANNGVIHAIDSVLLPPMDSTSTDGSSSPVMTPAPAPSPATPGSTPSPTMMPPTSSADGFLKIGAKALMASSVVAAMCL